MQGEGRRCQTHAILVLFHSRELILFGLLKALLALFLMRLATFLAPLTERFACSRTITFRRTLGKDRLRAGGQSQNRRQDEMLGLRHEN